MYGEGPDLDRWTECGDLHPDLRLPGETAHPGHRGDRRGQQAAGHHVSRCGAVTPTVHRHACSEA